MDGINSPDSFQVRDIRNKNNFQSTIQPEAPKNKKLGLISLFTKKNLPKTLLVIIILAVLVAAAAVIWGRSSFSKAKVDINIKAPDNIASGEEIVLTVKYKNNNRVALTNAQLIIDYPSGTFSLEGKEIFQKQKDIATIPRKSEGQEEFKARFVGQKGDVKNITAKINYQPQNINSEFENSSTFRLEINSVLIELDIEGSEKTISGQEVNYLIHYKNKTDEEIANLRLELEYSDDFEFKEADPSPITVEGETAKEKNNIWQIDSLKSGEEKTIDLKGVLKGEEGENKILKAIVGKIENDIFLQYSQVEYITQISPSPLLIDLKIEGIEEECNLNPGQELNYKIDFKNNTDIALNQLILKVHFDDKVFDFKEINLGGKGFFDSREKTITWSGAEIKELSLLEPNQSGQISFSIEIKESLPIFSVNDKNFQAKVLAEIQTLTVPAKFSVSELKIEKELACKINSQLDLDTKVYYYESEPGIVNTGPIPPKVDMLTKYTVHWEINNTSNALENVKVQTILPQGIEWLNSSINNVSNGRLSYNERTKEVIWEIDRVSAGVGVILPMYELIFQIGLKPSINQVGQTPTLINESSAEGKDKFTEKILKDFTPAADTSLPDDPQVSSNQGRVVE